jgi:hypothetical protein
MKSTPPAPSIHTYFKSTEKKKVHPERQTFERGDSTLGLNGKCQKFGLAHRDSVRRYNKLRNIFNFSNDFIFSLGRLFTRDAVIVEQDEQVACSNYIVSIEVSRA